MGNNVVVIQGEAQLKHNYQKLHPEYEKKYAQYLPQMNLTSEQMTAEYSVEIIIKSIKLRGSG
jgi:hypothetical protein